VNCEPKTNRSAIVRYPILINDFALGQAITHPNCFRNSIKLERWFWKMFVPCTHNALPFYPSRHSNGGSCGFSNSFL